MFCLHCFSFNLVYYIYMEDNETLEFYKDVDKDYFCANTLFTNLELFYSYLYDKKKYCKILIQYYTSRDKHKTDYWKERLQYEETNGKRN